ncbi:MAG: hypothetical protein N2511_05660 [Thermodesulfovibrionales bacterium]|nr:hypothetical protein [Thermodesulfovibrionales bacterium]
MNLLKYIMKNFTILNIFLMIIVSILAYLVIVPLLDMNIEVTIPLSKKTEIENPPAVSKMQMPMLSDFILIAEQNLFHPERKIPEKKDEKQLIKPEFVLYGTLITDTISIAYMEDLKTPYNTAGRGKRQKALQKGAMYSGFILSEIYHDKVIMVRGEERIEVRISDHQSKKPRAIETTTSASSMGTTEPPAVEVKSTLPEQPKRVRTPKVRNPKEIEEDANLITPSQFERESILQRFKKR